MLAINYRCSFLTSNRGSSMLLMRSLFLVDFPLAFLRISDIKNIKCLVKFVHESSAGSSFIFSALATD